MKLKQPPEDLAQLAKTMTKRQLRLRYGVSGTRINLWLDMAGVTAASSNQATRQVRPRPADFTTIAPSKTKTGLMAHYTATAPVIQRWLDESGVSASRYVPSGNSRIGKAHSLPAFVKVKSFYDEAADTLRRERFVVYRCDERGRYAERSDLWRVGNRVLTGDELLERAARYEVRAA